MIGDLTSLQTAINYRKELDERPANYQKPVVFFEGDALFDTDMYPNHEVAHVRTINHPVWGADVVRTSSIVYKFDDGSFETLNTIYKPYVEMMGN